MVTSTNILIVLLAFLLLCCVGWLILRQEKTLRLLRLQEEEKQNRFAIFSHRLRTPLTSIKWYVEMIQGNSFGTLTIAQKELLHKMENGVNDVIDLLNHFLEYAQGGFERLVSEPEAIDVTASIVQVLHALSLQAEQRHHHLIGPIGSEHAVVLIDPFLFHSIIDILISNAIFYTPDGGTISIEITMDKRYVTIAVHDTGIGIPQDEQQLIFRQFYRGRNAKHMHTQGNGLGLFYIKRLLERIGGTLRFDSTPKKGSTFYLQLPRA